MKWIIGVTTGLAVTALALVVRASTISARRRSAPRVYVRNRVLYGPGGFTYQLTDEDLLWLARSVYAEAGERSRGGAAVIWALAQYHALVLSRDGRRPVFSSLASLIRSYSVPVNAEAADPNGSWCANHASRCTPELLSYRESHRTISWERIPASVRQLVASFASGTLENPVPGATDWAAANWQARSATPLIDVGGNKFGVGRIRRMYSGE